MQRIDVRDETLSEVEVNGHIALFTDLRVDKATIPHGVNCYELRHGDDDSYPGELERTVAVNYFGTVFTTEDLLGNYERVEVGFDNFAFTGEEKQIYEIMGREPEILNAVGLVDFIEENRLPFTITDKEAELLLEYLDGHDYCLAQMDGCLYRGDMAGDAKRFLWSGYSMDDLIDIVCEWNYELILETEAARDNPKDFVDFVNNSSYYDKLKAEEVILDELFLQTKYNVELEKLAGKLANEVIANLKKHGSVEAAVAELATQVKQVVSSGRAR